MDRFLVFLGGVFSEDGPVKDPPVKLAPLQEHEFHRAPLCEWPSEKEHRSAAKAVLKLLPLVNEPHVMFAAIGWLFALLWAGEIRRLSGWGGFPHLVAWGSSGSGKTELFKLLWRLCAVPRTVEPFGLPMTAFTRLRLMSVANLPPVFFDEFRTGSWRPAEIVKFNHELRSIYGGETVMRGRRNLSEASYKLAATVMVAGEDRLRDPALEHRIIPIHLEKE